MNPYLKSLLNNRNLTKNKYNTFNKLFLILSLVLLNIGFIGFINTNLKIMYICEFILLLEFIFFSILAFLFRKKDILIIQYLDSNKIEFNIESLNNLLLKCSKKRKFLDLFSNIVLIFALLFFIFSLVINLNALYISKNIILTIFILISFMEWRYSKLIDKTISIVECTNPI